MNGKDTIFDYLAQILIVWGVSILSICVLGCWFGEAAQGSSTIFQLGKVGISTSTLLQFLALAVVITSLKFLFFTDVFIKNLRIMVRTVLMFVCIILSIALFAGIFAWFPVNEIRPWIMFFICFFVCAFFSVLVSLLKEKSDNKKMQEALERLKGEEL